MLRFNDRNGYRSVRGTLLNPISDTQCDFVEDGIIVAANVGDKWTIQSVGAATSIADQYAWDLNKIETSDGLILPPFYDVHFHWVQDDVREMPKTSLLEWLERYTFPEESRFIDPLYAEQKAKTFWKRILSVGTAGGLCYSSIHPTALDAAMRHAPKGFRVGNALMNTNCPTALTQTAQESIQTVNYGANQYGDRYCITPRFAPTTLPEVMKAGADIAREKGLFQQTHLCETQAEIDWVLDLYRKVDGFHDVQSYTEIYNRCGTLGPKTVMGHSIHLSDKEWELMASTDTAIASCPTSNAPVEDLGLGSGLFNFERAENPKLFSLQKAEFAGVRWALASDIGGGPFLSMLDVMDSFVRQNNDAGISGATYTKALFRSTAAGADILDMGKSQGNFIPGKSFDFVQFPKPKINKEKQSAEDTIKELVGLACKRTDFDSLPLATVLNGKTEFSKEAVPSD